MTTNHAMTVQQVADALGVSTAFVWRRCRVDPSFPRGFKLGKLRRWSQADIEGYISKLRGENNTAAQPT